MKSKLLHILTFIFLAFISARVMATHNRAGEITFKHINGNTYEFNVATYTYRPSAANVSRFELIVDWGDGTSQRVPRVDTAWLDNLYQYNLYAANHTFPGPGKYEVLMEDPNRNLGVLNIPNSVNTFFSVKTTIVVGANSGENSTPELLNPPVDQAARGHVFIHNPGAYDTDGDSISYKLTICTGADGVEIDGYVLPAASDTLLVDAITGNLIWDTPVDTGVYNIAMFIEEWRKGVRISRIARDMQIDVYETDNNPPDNSPLKDYCVLAGDSIKFILKGYDPEGDPVILSMFGGPLETGNPAKFTIDSTLADTTYATFLWKTNCGHARKFPYNIVVKAEDINSEINLVKISDFSIKVIHNAPQNLVPDPGVDSIRLTWDKSGCGNPSGYYIYRRTGSINYTPDSCEFGVPAYTGFEKIGTTYSENDTVFTDDNGGLGLVPGYDYCYMVTAYYKDGAESQASAEVCTTLISGIPAMLKVSVAVHGQTDGEIELAWAKPEITDTNIKPPYLYQIYRRAPGSQDYTPIANFQTNNVNDTTYTDKLLNTLVYPYFYRVTLSYLSKGNWIEIPGYETASSTYLDILPEDNRLNIEVLKRAPWLNRKFTFYRSGGLNGTYDSIATDSVNIYTDTGLKNGEDYYYRVKTTSVRPVNNTIYQVDNFSHINGAAPIDTVAPCPLKLNVSSICESGYNQLNWLPNTNCADNEIIFYVLYYKEEFNQQLAPIDTIYDISVTSYQHMPDARLAGCYAISAFDSAYNRGEIVETCVDSCNYYSLPNVFSPNNDGANDFYIASNLGGFIKQVEMTIFNRYGQEVFNTTDPYIRWNGRHKDSNRLVSTGVYYYVCNVYEPRINGVSMVTLTGFIHVYSGDNNAITKPE